MGTFEYHIPCGTIEPATGEVKFFRNSQERDAYIKYYKNTSFEKFDLAFPIKVLIDDPDYDEPIVHPGPKRGPGVPVGEPVNPRRSKQIFRGYPAVDDPSSDVFEGGYEEYSSKDCSYVDINTMRKIWAKRDRDSQAASDRIDTITERIKTEVEEERKRQNTKSSWLVVRAWDWISSRIAV